jgi:hypothetical protein
MNRPRELLLHGLLEDLKPRVNQLRELGWPANVRVEIGRNQGTTVVVVEIDLGPGLDIPIESVGPAT